MFFRGRRRGAGELDRVLTTWSPSDPWTLRHACQNTLVVGKTGSGKSSGAGDHLLRAVVRYPNSGGAIFASKPEDKAYVTRVFREERTLDDLLILEPSGRFRFNVLDYERRKGADARDLAQACMTFAETMASAEGSGGGARGGGEDAAFWAAAQRMMLHNAVEILLRGEGRVDPWHLQLFIQGAALSLEETADATWQGQYHSTLLRQAKRNAATEIEKHDMELAEQYWMSFLPRLNERTRTSIENGVMMTLHAMNTGVARALLATTTNVSPETLEGRKWLLVNMPVVPGDVTAAVVNGAVKYSMQRHILKRAAGPGDPLLCLFSDEFQKLANSYDALFLAECRSHKGCLIALTQSIHAMYANMGGGHAGEHRTDALLTNFGHVVAHTLGDHRTAEHFSALLGKRREVFINTSMQPGGDELFDLMMGRAQVSVSASAHYEPVIQPAVFLSGLRSGGEQNGKIVDGVVIRSGEPFRHSGENFLITSFRQR